MLVDREKTAVFDERGAKYGGYYLFDVPTLHYLANPIDKNTFRKACPEFIGFNQTKQIIPLRYWDTIFSLLQNMDSFYTAESQMLVEKTEEEMFAFKGQVDYQKNADAEYNAKHGVKPGKATKVERIRHKKFGEGVVTERKDGFLIVQFGKAGRKQLNEKVCLEKGLIEFG